MKVWSLLDKKGSLSRNFGPKKVSSTKKVLCHAQTPKFQLSLSFYLDTDQIMKVWSPLDKRISLHKVWSQKGFQYQKSTCHAQNPIFQLSLGFYLDTDQILKVWSLLDKRISLRKFLSQKGPKNQNWATKKTNPKDSRNTGVQLRKCHKDKICSPKIWSQKGFQYQKSTMTCPKYKFSTFIRFLPRYRPNPESLVTIGQTDLSPQILVPKRFPVPAGPKNQNLATKKKYTTWG